MKKKILVTGANGGFGKLTVHSLLKAGHQVAAGVRNPDGRNKTAADEFTAAGAHIADIDVTDENSVQNGVQKVIDDLDGLDVVVNNAGVGVIGFLEHFTIEDFQRLFDINVYGVHRVNRAAIPHLRNQGGGLLIHVSSLLGRITIPFYSPYNASKWALEALAEGYRSELSAFGIESVIVEPGGYATSFMEALIKPSDKSRDESYGDYVNAPIQMFESFEGALASNPAQDPQHVADAIVDLVDRPSGQRPFRTVVDKMGMGDHIVGYNEHLEKVTQGIYSAFGMADMLNVKEKE